MKFLSLPNYQRTPFTTSDGEELFLCLLEPISEEELEGLRGKTRDEIREAVKGVRG
jgi:hypothetical protein